MDGRPQPAQHARSSQYGRRASWRRPLTFVAVFTAAICIALAGYVVYALSLPVPAPKFTIMSDLATEITLDTEDVERAVMEETLPTAVGWLESDEVWSNDDTAYPLASISKLIAVLVTLEESPLDPDPESWGTYTWTAADADRQQYYQSIGGVVFPMPIGTEISMEDLFRLIFLPSSNDAITAYVHSVFPTNDAFVNAVDAWADRHGLTSVRLVEPTGLDEENVASAPDIVRIARIALTNPIVMQHTGVQTHTILGQTIENTNPLLGDEPNIVGLKTGRSLVAGFNFVVAQTASVDGREVTKISATLGRGSIAERAQSGRDMLAKLDPLPHTIEIMNAGEKIGTVTTWDGNTAPVTLDSGASLVFLPGETADVTLTLHETRDALRETTIGVLTIDAVTGKEHIDLVAERGPSEPPLSWRLMQPLNVLLTQDDE